LRCLTAVGTVVSIHRFRTMPATVIREFFSHNICIILTTKLLIILNRNKFMSGFPIPCYAAIYIHIHYSPTLQFMNY
jgi:hypothetical protein